VVHDACQADRSSGSSFALALINDPEVVFLDELTTGSIRRRARRSGISCAAIRAAGKTVFHDDALSWRRPSELCDRVAIIDHGRTLDMDSPEGLVAPALSGAIGRAPDG
jgi:ABC-2 type transport system ATP-binding protein